MRTSTFSVESLVQLTYISFISDIGQCCMGLVYCKTIIKNLHTRLVGEEGIKEQLCNLVLTQILMVLKPPKLVTTKKTTYLRQEACQRCCLRDCL